MRAGKGITGTNSCTQQINNALSLGSHYHANEALGSRKLSIALNWEAAVL